MDSARVSALLKRGLAHSARGNYARAETWLRKALASAPRAAGLFIADRPALRNELGMVCKYLGKLDSAERYYRLALRHACRCPGSPEREFFLANLYHNLGGVEHSRRRFSRAEEYASQGLELRLTCATPGGIAVAFDQAALATILDGQRRYAESERLYRQALRTYRREYRSHPEIAVVMNNLGAHYQATGQPKRAESYYRAALKKKRQKLPGKHQW